MMEHDRSTYELQRLFSDITVKTFHYLCNTFYIVVLDMPKSLLSLSGLVWTLCELTTGRILIAICITLCRVERWGPLSWIIHPPRTLSGAGPELKHILSYWTLINVVGLERTAMRHLRTIYAHQICEPYFATRILHPRSTSALLELLVH